MRDDPVAGKRRDLLDDIIAADEVAANQRDRKERRVFRVAVSLVVVLAVAVVLFATVAFAAILNNAGQRAAASRRIDKLTASNEQLARTVQAQNVEIGRLRSDVGALRMQVEQLGGDPVVIVTPAASSTTTSTTNPPPPTTTTTTPPPEEPPPDEPGFCIGPICVGA